MLRALKSLLGILKVSAVPLGLRVSRQECQGLRLS